MTKRSPQLISAILDGFADGISLRQLCRDHGISRTSFTRWKRDDPDLAFAYAQAQGDYADVMEEESLEIADSALAAAMSLPSDVEAVGVRERLWFARLRIDTRFRIAGGQRRAQVVTMTHLIESNRPAPAAPTALPAPHAALPSPEPFDRAALMAVIRAGLGDD